MTFAEGQQKRINIVAFIAYEIGIQLIHRNTKRGRTTSFNAEERYAVGSVKRDCGFSVANLIPTIIMQRGVVNLARIVTGLAMTVGKSVPVKKSGRATKRVRNGGLMNSFFGRTYLLSPVRK